MEKSWIIKNNNLQFKNYFLFILNSFIFKWISKNNFRRKLYFYETLKISKVALEKFHLNLIDR